MHIQIMLSVFEIYFQPQARQCPAAWKSGYHDHVQVCGGEMGEKEEQSGSCTVKRSRTEDMM